MAIDTAAKRSSVLGRNTLPVPDGSVDEGDRAHLAYKYAGIDYQALVDLADVINLTGIVDLRVFLQGRVELRPSLTGIADLTSNLQGEV